MQATLQTAAFGTVSQALSGKILIESSVSGVLTRYELPHVAGGLIPQEVSALLLRLLDRFDAAVAYLAPGSSDSLVYARMYAQMKTVRSYAADHSAALIR